MNSLLLVSKIAAHQETPLTPQNATAAAIGFAEYLTKEAGMSEPEAYGVMCWFAEQGGMEKMAEVEDAIPGVLGAKKLYQAGRDIVNKGQKVIADTNHAAGKARVEGMMDGFTGKVKGYYDQAKGWISDPKNLQGIAPHLISGAATYLGARGMGMGVGGAALAGVAGGYAGGEAWKNRDAIMKSLKDMQGKPQEILPPVGQKTTGELEGQVKSLSQSSSEFADRVNQINNSQLQQPPPNPGFGFQ